MNKILIIGASSYIGARSYLDLSNWLKTTPILGTYATNQISEKFVKLDITNREEVKNIFSEFEPTIVIHFANNANPRWCEENKERARLVNQDSTKYICDECNNYGSKLIYISSNIATNNCNFYAQTKIESEKIVSQLNKYSIVRPSFTLGYSPNTKNDRGLNRILKNISGETEAIYDTSWKFQPTYLGQISEIIFEIINRELWNKTIPVITNSMKSRFDICNDILSHFDITAKPVDLKDPTPHLVDNYQTLIDLNLPTYTYEEIVKKIVEEIKTPEKFVI